MKLKTYSAATMAQALARVKREVGHDAVILRTRSYKRGGILGFGARTVVEVTAADGKQVGRVNRKKAERSPRRQALDAAARRKPVSVLMPSSPPPMPPIDAESQMAAGDLIKRTYAAAKAEMQQPVLAPAPTPAPAIATIAPFSGLPGGPGELAGEMQSVKRMVARMMHQQQKASPPTTSDMPDALFDQYRTLIEQEVAEEIADEVVAEVRSQLDDEQIEDPKACRQAVLKAVTTLLPTLDTPDTPSLKPRAKRSEAPDRPRTIALVGPTGVGKTTTIAKLAANLKLKEKKRVGLVTLDTYRIAAVEQLRTYAQIIGIPLRVVSCASELVEAVANMTDCDVVLIDTAGRSQRNDERLDELARVLETVSPDEVHLVLSSTCTQSVLLEVVERFEKIRTDRVIFTKLDEAVTFGVLVNVLKKVGKQLSYVTTGQEVPHQIEPAQPGRLAALVLGENGV